MDNAEAAGVQGGAAPAHDGKTCNLQSAEAQGFAGPYLRYGGGTGGTDTTRWWGSVLFLTHSSGGSTTSDARADAAAGDAAAAGPPPPLLVLTDATHSGEHRPAAALLDTIEGWSFWRYDVELPLVAWQRPLTYQLQLDAGGAATPTFTFWLPAAGQPMHWGYYSCNGFSSSVPEDAPERQDPTYLWRDLLQLHSAFPLHCLLGGGDQLYSDGVFQAGGSAALLAWGDGQDHTAKVSAPWTAEMEAQATTFYLRHYLEVFGGPDVRDAFAQILQLMMWDDHDIWDGYGSYDADMQGCPVFAGLFAVARRLYLLFQQHTTDAFNARAREFLTNDGSEWHFLRYMGPQVVVLGIDMRSQRTKTRILPQATYELLDRTVAELPRGPQHLVVLSGVPVVFPTVPLSETILGGLASMGRRMPRFANFCRSAGMNDRFDQPEILDDLLDGWMATVHKKERLQFLHMLQGWSRGCAMRVSILSGDAHVGGVGRFYSRPKINPISDDPLYMVQIISSAIMNAPPGHKIIRMLLRTNWTYNVDGQTRSKLIRAFYPTHPRTDKLLGQRNWCDITLIAPPFTPPTVPGDPNFGGLRFTIRAENTRLRRGHCEEVYHILVPRHPAAAKGLIATGSTAAENVPTAALTAAAAAADPRLPLHLASAVNLPGQTLRPLDVAGGGAAAASGSASP